MKETLKRTVHIYICVYFSKCTYTFQVWKGKKDFEEKLFHRIQKSLFDCSSKTSESVQHQLKFKKEVREQLSFFQKNKKRGKKQT